MKYDIIFESNRIYFIKITSELVQDYLTMVNDKDIQKLISNKIKNYTLEDELNWIKDNLEKNSKIFSMIEKETNEYIGNIEIKIKNNNIGELGICIANNKQDKHYGQESITRIIEYAFDELEIDNMDLYVFNFNDRAIACYEKVGFIKKDERKERNDIHMVLKK